MGACRPLLYFSAMDAANLGPIVVSLLESKFETVVVNIIDTNCCGLKYFISGDSLGRTIYVKVSHGHIEVTKFLIDNIATLSSLEIYGGVEYLDKLLDTFIE